MHRSFRVFWIAAALIALQAFVLYLFGQPAICECGYIKMWEGGVGTPGNSQHIADWYTFSHIIHGFIFYALLSYFFPRLSVWQRLVIAIGIEGMWEIAENSPQVIEHYRQQALAAGYTGDSMLNSIADTFWMSLGFVLAARLPTWATISLAVVFELFVAYMIRDNLTLNIIGLVHVFPAISAWQSAP